jgi:hypothetical protein
MINLDQALTWVSWAFFSGLALGVGIGVSLTFAMCWRELPLRSHRGRALRGAP